MKRPNAIKIVIITISLSVSLCVFVFYGISDIFSPGSYPYAEEYEIEASEKALIKATNKFKIDHPAMIPPDSIGLKDGRSDSPDDHWYHIYFYYPQEDQLLNTWIRSSDTEHSTFALTAINEGTTLGNWKRINKDFNRADNRAQKSRFERQVLDKIKANLE